ncbi:leucine--tRNA ligase [Candidatus Roizmanbacteria bacterium RIFCSPLOWO2_01_FULL_37_12]|uniref:Leucine--tRNA ligase n=1 Tax=Candidatus Roizmanbacteria bacterium RIFCSPLOWO2_01_FULL_37_12 TaxID=1802056 RepID=A0A1F7IEW0_9BACT|nr:MAG: leucine--tRNA ligase [Candidatus Roizmanbacteria bacterium RIFCSPHIGHO2_02_FULL_37_9b]OGK41891.1 MAG: leucine--tRNA ligase [Candidatus Roizmanbacteria bacterium RIFCSPLOWO2_01_FULL_37_12]
MTIKYQPKEFEAKWREKWKTEGLYGTPLRSLNQRATLGAGKKKFYTLVELPYTSGDLHVGHWFSFTIPDILARFKRMSGFNVFYPIGYDAFGLPAENAAIKHNIHPKDWTLKNVEVMTKQFQTMGTMLNNWEDVVVTCFPEYYRWNQWIFLKMYERGLAYRGKALSNWCPSCQTVLANENIEMGKCWRCGTEVVQKEVEQWFLRITKYADRLLWARNPQGSGNANGVDWPKQVQVGQNNWIGKKEGINITYKVISNKDGSPEILSQLNSLSFRTLGQSKSDKKVNRKSFPQDQLKHPVSKNLGSPSIKVIDEITCFTTTPVNFGATFLVLAPEHPFVKKILTSKIKSDKTNFEKIIKYVEHSNKMTEEQRKIAEKDKTGVFTSFYAINHVTGKPIPIWISDFVLMNVGTGAVQGCPGHDYRDFEFAKKFGIPIPRVVTGPNGEKGPIEKKEDVVEHGGVMVNSDFLNGIPFSEAMQMTMDYFKEKGWGKRVVTYHLRDWSISRQRYWGTPVPMINCPNCGIVSVPEKDLPVELPYVVDFMPKGKPPLATNEKWMNVKCPNCGAKAKRDPETLDTFFDSAWYWYRYVSPHYSNGPFDKLRVNHLTPVDVYFGGSEHTLGHTMYARFFTKFFRDLGLVDYEEFALKRIQHGVVLGPDGNRMSKSKGNVINPDDVVAEYGTDTVRMYLCFMMPYEATGPWSDKTIQGVHRFLNRVWRMFQIYQINQKTENGSQNIRKSDKSDIQFSRFHPPSSSFSENKQLIAKLNKTIQKVTNDIEKIKMNTAIAAMMEFINAWEEIMQKLEGKRLRSQFGEEVKNEVKEKTHTSSPLNKTGIQTQLPLTISHAKDFLKILSPFAPHMTEEIWRNVFGEKESIHLSEWPKAKELVTETVTIPVQVNGKVRDLLIVNSELLIDEKKVTDLALKSEKVKKYLEGKKYKIIYVKGKILNLVVS